MRHKRLFTAALVVAVVVATAPVGAAGAPTTDAAATGATNFSLADNETESNETNVTPGERLSGVVSVQAAEIDGDLEERSFGIRVAQAASNASKAAVIDETVADLRERLADLREQRQRLREARTNGSMSQGEYAARIASLSARTETVRQLANRTETEFGKLPPEVLAERGVDVTAIRALQRDAADVAGPEVAALARTIAGPNVGSGSDGPQTTAENVTVGADSTTDETTTSAT